MPAVPVSVLPRRRASRASPTSRLPHWSEITAAPRHAHPSPTVAAVLRDLVAWAADIAIVLTRGCPEDRDAIERVRRYAYAWLAGERCPEVEIDDVLTTAAALMAGIDRDLGGTPSDDDERQAIGAAVAA
jgi:hypothetical protein